MGQCCTTESFLFERVQDSPNMDRAVANKRAHRDETALFIVKSPTLIKSFQKNSLTKKLPQVDADNLTFFFMHERRMSIQDISLLFLIFYKPVFNILFNDKLSIESEIFGNKFILQKFSQLNQHEKLQLTKNLNLNSFLHIYELSSIAFMKRFCDYKKRLILNNEYTEFREVNYELIEASYDNYAYDSYDDDDDNDDGNDNDNNNTTNSNSNDNKNENGKRSGGRKNSKNKKKGKEIKCWRLNDEYNYYNRKSQQAWLKVDSTCIIENGEKSMDNKDFDSECLEVIDEWLYYENKKDIIYSDAVAYQCVWIKDIVRL